MTGSLYYEVTASGRRVALCVDKADAEMVAEHWYDGRVKELPNVFIGQLTDNTIVALAPVTMPHTITYNWPAPAPTGVAKRKEDTQPEPAQTLSPTYPVCPRCGERYNPTLTAGTCH